MGYQRKPKLYTLKWAEDQELHGLEVVIKGLSVEQMLEMGSLAEEVTASMATAVKADRAQVLFHRFAGRLVSWNLEDDEGRPVPATYEGVASQDLDFAVSLVTAWIDAIASVDSPLPNDSKPGAAPGPEASLPMEPLPLSRGS